MLIIMRGISGAGKSTLCREVFHPSTVLSSDHVRNEMIGTTEVEPSSFAKVFSEIRRRLEHRMSLGRLTVVDATHTSLKSIRSLTKVASAYGEPFFILDLMVDFDRCARRVYRRRIGADVGAILPPEKHQQQRDRYQASMASVEEFAGDSYFRGNYPQCVAKARDLISGRNVYQCDSRRVYIFGDIHGCKSILRKALDTIEDEALIFTVGDMIDRGEDSMGTLKMIKNDPRFVGFATGNHESAFIQELLHHKGKSVSTARQKTHEEYRRLPKAEQEEILDFLHSGRAYWLLIGPSRNRVLVTHAGVGQFDPEMVSTFQSSTDRANSVLKPRPHLVDIDVQVHGHMSWQYTGDFSGPIKNIDAGCGKIGRLLAYCPFEPERSFFTRSDGTIEPLY